MSVSGISALIAILCFVFFSANRDFKPPRYKNEITEIVLPAPVQVFLYAGDNFLAANIEAVRASIASQSRIASRSSFPLRAHLTAAKLNHCHEDNYWIGNDVLSWAGAVDDGLYLLKLATQCRYWDEFPPFFYGFNQQFLKNDITSAKKYLEIAAQRSKENSALYRNFAIMLEVGKIDDAQMALNLLTQERNKAKDQNLRKMLEKRIERLNGLIVLRNAQTTYESRFHQKLEKPHDLLDSGILKSFPADPLKIGYEFRNNRFYLRHIDMSK